MQPVLSPRERAYWSVLDPAWKKISIYDGPAVFARQLARFPSEVGHLFCTHWCQSEVRNGGLLQLFWNSTGVLAPEAIAGFEALGLPAAAAPLREAVAVFGPTYPRQRRARLAFVDRLEIDFFNPLSRRFCDAVGRNGALYGDAADAYALAFERRGQMLH